MVGPGPAAGLGTAVAVEPPRVPGTVAASDLLGDSFLAPEGPGAVDRARKVILVVSAGAEPSRALVVTNLAAAFAEAGEEALVVTTVDLRHRELLQETQVMASVGTDFSPPTVAAATRPTDIPGVRSLALSRLIDGPGQLASRAPAVLAAARTNSDVVLVDAPLLGVHDAEALVPAVDLVLMVIQSGFTKVDHATRSGVFLRRISAPVLGSVFTEVRLSPKDIRRVVAGPPSQSDAEEEDRLVRASRMARLGRRRRRGSEWVEA